MGKETRQLTKIMQFSNVVVYESHSFIWKFKKILIQGLYDYCSLTNFFLPCVLERMKGLVKISPERRLLRLIE